MTVKCKLALLLLLLSIIIDISLCQEEDETEEADEEAKKKEEEQNDIMLRLDKVEKLEKELNDVKNGTKRDPSRPAIYWTKFKGFFNELKNVVGDLRNSTSNKAEFEKHTDVFKKSFKDLLESAAKSTKQKFASVKKGINERLTSTSTSTSTTTTPSTAKQD